MYENSSGHHRKGKKENFIISYMIYMCFRSTTVGQYCENPVEHSGHGMRDGTRIRLSFRTFCWKVDVYEVLQRDFLSLRLTIYLE